MPFSPQFGEGGNKSFSVKKKKKEKSCGRSLPCSRISFFLSVPSGVFVECAANLKKKIKSVPPFTKT